VVTTAIPGDPVAPVPLRRTFFLPQRQLRLPLREDALTKTSQLLGKSHATTGRVALPSLQVAERARINLRCPSGACGTTGVAEAFGGSMRTGCRGSSRCHLRFKLLDACEQVGVVSFEPPLCLHYGVEFVR